VGLAVARDPRLLDQGEAAQALVDAARDRIALVGAGLGGVGATLHEHLELITQRRAEAVEGEAGAVPVGEHDVGGELELGAARRDQDERARDPVLQRLAGEPRGAARQVIAPMLLELGAIAEAELDPWAARAGGRHGRPARGQSRGPGAPAAPGLRSSY